MTASPGEIVTAVRRAVVHLSTQGAAFAREHGMNLTDIRALIALNDLRRAGEAATPGTLGRELGLASASTTQVIDRLERRGLVRRGADPGDRRRVLIEVTKAAAASGVASFGPLLEEIRALACALGPGERDVVLAFLDGLSTLPMIDQSPGVISPEAGHA
ncbi:MAG: MarR family transcriptional regulator [Austwickia sp.]|jgi:DNA-binding MarR family transcriptional regulator|nr:MAG: MarR family transcriptional regulator [Austwickia sp.]